MATEAATQTGPRLRERDRELCIRLRDGVRSAFDELLKREWSSLVDYAEQFTGSADDAEDVAQRAFVRIWRRRKHLDPDRSVRALLYRTVRNLTIDVQRKSRTRRSARQRLRQTTSRTSPTPHDRLRERELRGAIHEVIEALSPRRREAFMLCRMHGLSHTEAAEVMELAPQTVSNHVTAALKQVRTALAPRLD